MSSGRKRTRPEKRVRKASKKLPNPTVERNDHPPQLNAYQISQGMALRYTCTSDATNVAITFADLLDTVLIATTATAGYDLFDVVKIKRISVWAQGTTLGSPVTAQVVFPASTNVGDATIHTDTSLGLKPAYVVCRPSQKSLSSFWNTSSGTTAFTLTCPTGSIIDVHLSFKTSSKNPAAAQAALVAATAGEMYFRGLDGNATASTQFQPPTGIQIQ